MGCIDMGVCVLTMFASKCVWVAPEGMHGVHVVSGVHTPPDNQQALKGLWQLISLIKDSTSPLRFKTRTHTHRHTHCCVYLVNPKLIGLICRMWGSIKVMKVWWWREGCKEGEGKGHLHQSCKFISEFVCTKVKEVQTSYKTTTFCSVIN